MKIRDVNQRNSEKMERISNNIAEKVEKVMTKTRERRQSRKQ